MTAWALGWGSQWNGEDDVETDLVTMIFISEENGATPAEKP